MEKLTVAMVSLENNPGKLGENVDRMAFYAKECEADVVCFPVASLTGYDLRNPTFTYSASADVSNMVFLAHTLKKVIVFGYFEDAHGRRYIAQQIATPAGNSLICRKSVLSADEAEIFLPGEPSGTVDIGKAKVAVRMNGEESVGIDGADLVLVPSAISRDARDVKAAWSDALTALAKTKECAVCACNAKFHTSGAVMNILPDGSVISENFKGGEVAVIEDLPAH